MSEDHDEAFQAWLDEMEHALEDLENLVGDDDRGRLDFTIPSLAFVESWLLARYPTEQDAAKRSERAVTDAVSRYVGETLLARTAGQWKKREQAPRLPVLADPDGKLTEVAPLVLVQRAVRERTGNVFEASARERAAELGTIQSSS